MKAIVNSELLHQASKLVKAEWIEVLVKNRQVKIIAADCNGVDFDNEVIIKSSYFGNEEEGSVMIPTYLINLLDKNENVEVMDGFLKSNNREIKFKSDAENYKEIEDNGNIDLFIKDFEKVTSVKYAMEKINTRPVLTCICINNNESVALDGYRMAITKLDDNLTSKEILIPQDVVKMHRKLKDKNIVSVTSSDDYLKFNFGSITIIRKKQDGKYVNYNSLFPKKENIKTNFKIDAAYLYEIVNRIYKTHLQHNNLINMNLTKENAYILSYDHSSEVKFNLKNYELKGEDIEIGLDCRYLVEALKRYRGTIELSFDSPVTPIILEDHKENKDLILPIRLLRPQNNVIDFKR